MGSGMAETAGITGDLRDRLIREPEVILEDRDLMRALIAANERAMGANIVDLRGVAMERLEARLDRLEDTHRSVIAAAYDNLAGTNQIHRAILKMLEPLGFGDFVANMAGEVAQILRVDLVRLVLESRESGDDPALRRLGGVVQVAPAGAVDAYMGGGRPGQPRTVVLRTIRADLPDLYGNSGDWLRSEALMRLDLGEGRLPGMLVLAAEDPHQFRSSQGTDLLAFFASVFERAMRRWLG
jgi:uncharacterized protein YigA (DUF484 family)